MGSLQTHYKVKKGGERCGYCLVPKIGNMSWEVFPPHHKPQGQCQSSARATVTVCAKVNAPQYVRPWYVLALVSVKVRTRTNPKPLVDNLPEAF